VNTTEFKWDTNLYKLKHSFVYDFSEELIKLLDPQKNEKILDLGCGTGQLTAKLSRRAPKVIGMDKSPEMIEEAKSNFPELNFNVGDATNFNFDEKFDAIFSNATLHWVTDFRRAIESMSGNLKNGGRMVVEFGGKGNVQLIVDQLRKQLRDIGQVALSETQLWYFPSTGEYRTELERAGIKVKLAELYDRPTELADRTNGIKDWLTMFAKPFFEGIANDQVDEILSTVQQNLKPLLFKNGKWYADYKRIRVVAEK